MYENLREIDDMFFHRLSGLTFRRFWGFLFLFLLYREGEEQKQKSLRLLLGTDLTSLCFLGKHCFGSAPLSASIAFIICQ